MSVVPASWVKRKVACDPLDKFVLWAIADEADDEGYASGKRFASADYLAETTCMNRKTVLEAVRRAEHAGHLLVRRPDDRKRDGEGRGRHNEYVVLMGRDPDSVRSARGWSRPPSVNWSAPRANSNTASPDEPPSSSGPEDAMDRPDDRSTAPRGHEAAPPATHEHQPPEAVDGAPTPESDWSAPRTDTPRTSPGLVQDWSVQDGPSPCPRVPEELARSAREARSVDNLDRVAETLAAAGVAVAFDVGAERREQLVAHLERWPSIEAGVAAYVAAAQARIRQRGIPESARAWASAWLELTPPPAVIDLSASCPVHPDASVATDGECGGCRADRLARA